MRFLILSFLLFNINNLFADVFRKVEVNDVMDFDIEGIHLGELVTEHFSISYIANHTRENYYDAYKDPYRFTTIAVEGAEYTQNWELVEVTFDSKNLVIHAVTGGNFYDSNFDKCYNDLNRLAVFVEKIYPEAPFQGPLESFHQVDPYQESTFTHQDFFLNNGTVSIHCYDWSKRFSNQYGWTDNIQLQVRSNQLNDYINNDLK